MEGVYASVRCVFHVFVCIMYVSSVPNVESQALVSQTDSRTYTRCNHRLTASTNAYTYKHTHTHTHARVTTYIHCAHHFLTIVSHDPHKYTHKPMNGYVHFYTQLPYTYIYNAIPMHKIPSTHTYTYSNPRLVIWNGLWNALYMYV